MAPQELRSRRAKILCIEKDLYLADLLHYVLTREGYRVRIAASRADALRSMRIEPCDLALLDVHLPGLSGYSLCLCRQTETSAGESALMAWYADIANIQLEPNGNSFIPKPFRLRALLARIRSTLASTEHAGQGRTTTIRLLRPQRDLVGAASWQVPVASLSHNFVPAER